MSKRQIKMIISDIDGTLSAGRNHISKETLKCIDYISRFTPCYFVLASGRPLVHIQSLVEKYLLPVEYVISSNGSTITSLYPHKKVIYKKNISKSSVNKFFKYVDERNLLVLWSEDNILHRNFDLEQLADFEYRNDPFMVSSILRKRPWPGAQTDKFMICMPDKSNDELQDIIAFFQKTFVEDLAITTAGMRKVIEANAAGVNKGNAAKFLLDYLNIEPENIMVAGDAMNDFEMLKLPGISVAMGNAHPDLKKIADYVSVDSNKDGLVKAINNFLF